MNKINNLKNNLFKRIKQFKFGKNKNEQKRRKESQINYLLMKFKQNQLEQAYRQQQNKQKLIHIGILIFWNLIFLILVFCYFNLNFYIPISFFGSCLCFGLVYYFPKIIQILFFTINIMNSLLYSLTLSSSSSLNIDEGNVRFTIIFVAYIVDPLIFNKSNSTQPVCKSNSEIYTYSNQLLANLAATKSFNFLINTVSSFLSFIIIWWFLGFSYTWMLFYICGMMCSIDYLYQFTTRRHYYQKQKEKEWREIIHQIVPLKILVSEFDYRTMRLNLYDCSRAAQSYIKQQVEDEDKYNKFLEKVVLNIDTSKIQFKQFQETENLKKYLTHRFIMIDDFIKKNEKLLMKNVSTRIKKAQEDIRKQFTFQQEKYDDKKYNKEMTKMKSKFGGKTFTQFDIRTMEIAQLDEMEGYYYLGDADTDPTKKKKIRVKVAYHSVQNSQPLLVISIEDESLREDIEFYKEEKQKSDQFITNMLENYRTTLIKNLAFFNQGWIVVRANFEEIFRNTLILVNKCYTVYDYFLFLRIRRQFKGISHKEQLSLMKSESFNFTSMLKYLIEIFHNIDILCEIGDDTVVFNDEKRIKQVFISLITNCIKISVSAISINIYESSHDDIQVIFVHIGFYKDEDNPLQGILDHLDGTESPYVNQIEQIVLQDIVRSIGPFSLKAQTSPNGCCEIEFAIYGDLRKFKKIFEIQDQDEDDISKNQQMEQGEAIRNMKAEQFQRKNKRYNKTFFDLKNFNQMESIVGIPRGSKLISKELRNQLKAFVTLKDQNCNLEDEDYEEGDNDNDLEGYKDNEEYQEDTVTRRNEELTHISSKKGMKLVTVEQQEEEEEEEVNFKDSQISSQRNRSQFNQSILRNSEMDNCHTYKTVEQDEESSRKSATRKSRQNNMEEQSRRSRDHLTLSRINSQTQVINLIQNSAETSSQGGKTKHTNVNTLGGKEREIPFNPKKLTSSFTTFRMNTIEDLETSDRKQLTYRQPTRNKSGGKHQYLDYSSQKSLTQNYTHGLHTDSYKGEKTMKGVLQTSSTHSIFDFTNKYKEEKSKLGSGLKLELSSHTIYIDEENDDKNACNLTFQADKSELEINDFIPRLR